MFTRPQWNQELKVSSLCILHVRPEQKQRQPIRTAVEMGAHLELTTNGVFDNNNGTLQ